MASALDPAVSGRHALLGHLQQGRDVGERRARGGARGPDGPRRGAPGDGDAGSQESEHALPAISAGSCRCAACVSALS
jgi:hypothetical protein